MKILILLNVNDGNYTLEKIKDTNDNSFIKLNDIFWDDENIISMYCNSKDKKESILKLKNHAIEWHKNCIEKLK